MQVAFYLAGEITQVEESIPWVRCASGNVFVFLFSFCLLYTQTLMLFADICDGQTNAHRSLDRFFVCLKICDFSIGLVDASK